MALGSKPQQHTRSLSETYFEKRGGGRKEEETTTTNLGTLLSNSLVLYEVIPYLPISARLSLASTSRAYRDYLSHTPGVFRHLDLSQVKRAQLDSSPSGKAIITRGHANDDVTTEDDVYSAPLRSILFQDSSSFLRRHNLLQDVQTLILDGLSVTAELCHDLIVGSSSSSSGSNGPSSPQQLNIRILSIRECKNLNENKLMQTLRYACRPTRPEGSLRLEGLYIFGKKDSSTSITTSSSKDAAVGKPNKPSNPNPNKTITTDGFRIDGLSPPSPSSSSSQQEEQPNWYSTPGLLLPSSSNPPISLSWAETLSQCHLTAPQLHFDAPLCSSPRHRNSPAYGRCLPLGHDLASGGIPGGAHRATAMPPYAVATFSMKGCATCGEAPEGFTSYHGGKKNEAGLPLLLGPVPLHSSSGRSACRPGKGDGKEEKKFIPRCLECIKERYCSSCDQWWCEACYEVPGQDDVVVASAMHNGNNNNVHHPHNMLQQQQVQIVGSDYGSENGEDGLMALEEELQLQQPKGRTRKIVRGCWDCELSCETCLADTQKRCQACGGGYCIIHYEGSTHTFCDWCASRSGRRHRGDMY